MWCRKIGRPDIGGTSTLIHVAVDTKSRRRFEVGSTLADKAVFGYLWISVQPGRGGGGRCSTHVEDLGANPLT